MLSQEFLNYKKPIDENIMEELIKKTERLKKLDYGKNNDWSGSTELKNIVNLLGEDVPIKLLKDLVSYYNSEKNKLNGREIPEIMQRLGVDELQLKNGTKIKLTTNVSTKIINNDKALSWLEENGYEDFIKGDLEFSKGELNKNLFEFLKREGYSYKEKIGIHFQSLNKIIKDRINDGEELPEDNIININIYPVAKIK